MIEFAQNYGLWIALAGVFIAMHWFGMGCCSGRREEKPTQGQGVPGKEAKGEPGSGATPRPKGSCH